MKKLQKTLLFSLLNSCLFIPLITACTPYKKDKQKTQLVPSVTKKQPIGNTEDDVYSSKLGPDARDDKKTRPSIELSNKIINAKILETNKFINLETYTLKETQIFLEPKMISNLKKYPFLRLYTSDKTSSLLTFINVQSIVVNGDKKFVILDFEFDPNYLKQKLTNNGFLEINKLAFVQLEQSGANPKVTSEEIYDLQQPIIIKITRKPLTPIQSPRDQIALYTRDINKYVHIKKTNLYPSQITNNDILIDFSDPKVIISPVTFNNANDQNGTINVFFTITIDNITKEVNYMLNNLATRSNNNFLSLNNKPINASEYIKDKNNVQVSTKNNNLIISFEANNFYNGQIENFINQNINRGYASPRFVYLVIQVDEQEFISHATNPVRNGTIKFVFDNPSLLNTKNPIIITAIEITFFGHNIDEQPFRMVIDPTINTKLPAQ
ncbi:lipoprotein 17-related variable surface protein [Ureaplasma sp. ES3154-GEN]|uniref:lipoprotein 17-related variable surface protein n=1 Tax=Ureaplasma sp. ES3154-GEN TaxID=2984844 RepID=UPI0021E868B4|nr:lipoprotein 17-related variable surface protein [Ureaplasma sp. ES3154-GEN]MCV3743493.1 lipoprotein 17-related variable surface protein [Ureaplasma sp. ES3154-GEN]